MFGFRSYVTLSGCNSCYLSFQSSHLRRKCTNVNICKSVLSSPDGCSLKFAFSKQKGCFNPLKLVATSSLRHESRLGFPFSYQRMSFGPPISTQKNISRVNWNRKHTFWMLGGISIGLCLSFSTSGRVYAEASLGKNDCAPSVGTSHGKKVYTDYSITGIPGDGRCLFRSVAHGACIRSGKPLPDDLLQRELADDLRARVADEFVKRRAESEWFVEGDFDAYVSHIRKPHVWGGEPELFMASHVLNMPITVYMHDEDSGGLIAIAEYGQEYGKDDPIQVLYHGFGHYDALQIPGKKGAKSRL